MSYKLTGEVLCLLDVGLYSRNVLRRIKKQAVYYMLIEGLDRYLRYCKRNRKIARCVREADVDDAKAHLYSTYGHFAG